MELLRLLRWCPLHCPRDFRGRLLQGGDRKSRRRGYLKRHAKSGAYVLTGRGGRLLDTAFSGHKLPQAQRAYREADIQRRLYIARLTVTAFRAGINVFTAGIEDLRKEPALFLPSNSRGRGANPGPTPVSRRWRPWGTRPYAVHHVRPGIGRLLFSDELARLHPEHLHAESASAGVSSSSGTATVNY